MLRHLQHGKADGVIIHKIDRSARNLKDWADLGELIDQGIDVHFANESLDLHSRGGRLSADIQAVVASDYIRNLREETRKGFYGRIKQGLYPLPAPIGYLDRGKGKVKEPDPIKAPLVTKAFELYAGGEFNLQRLGDELYGLGLRNRNGRRISLNGLSWMLNNPFYIGLIRLKRTGETFPGSHDPLISKLLFDRVQRILDGKTNAFGWRHTFTYRRLLKCKHCGLTLIGEVQKGHKYYRCHTPGCPTKCVREEVVEYSVLDLLSKIQLNEKEIAYLEQRTERVKKNWESGREDLLKSITLRIAQLRDRLSRLTDAFIDRAIEKDIYEERKAALLMERKDLEEIVSQIKDGNRSIPNELAKFLELQKGLSLQYEMALSEERRDLLKLLTSNRRVNGKSVEFELVLPFNLIANRPKFSNSAPLRDGDRTLDPLFDKLVKHFEEKLAAEDKGYRLDN